MAIQKDIIQDNKATPISYWKYGRFVRLTNGATIQNGDCPKDDNGEVIPQKGIVIAMLGYVSAESREAAKTNGRGADFVHEFLVYNWVERKQNTKPMPLKERRALPAFAGIEITDEELLAMDYDVITGETETPHNDFDTYMGAINTADEAGIAYGILEKHPSSREFFKDSKDV